jgi:3-methyl-2-oxobutanoate hydroxymethyltransferase
MGSWEAMRVYEHVKQLEAAGAVGAEIEVVPARVATEISRRTSLILLIDGRGRRGRRAISVR